MPVRFKHLIILFSILSNCSLVHGQDTTRVTSNELNRPSIELGLGSLNYFGDIGKLDGISSSKKLNWGYHFKVRNSISNSFGLNLFVMFGEVSANERLIDNDANFESKIRMGGLELTYNFNAILPKERLITPYLSIGITSFEFSPKGDYRDESGQQYFYWNDGSIRNLPQNAPNASEAINLYRDYNYETDLRNTRDRSEQYSLRSYSIPIGAGVNLDVSQSFSLRMGMEFHFTTTDYLDNIASSEMKNQPSKKGNDNFLYTSVGLAYNLKYKNKQNTPGDDFGLDNLSNIEYADQDGDGIADIVDKCPNTPMDAVIDAYGCPVDNDKDGIPDFRDLELKTEEGALVNLNGETASSEEIENMYRVYKDSIGDVSIQKSQTYTADIKRNNLRFRDKNKGYRIEITNGNDLGSDDIGELLSIQDVRSEEVDGRTVYFLGDYTTLTEAVSRKLSLDKSNFESKLIYVEYGEQTELAQSEIDGIAASINPTEFDSNQVIFRVQIGAYRYRLSSDVFRDVPDLLIIEGNDGLTRYVSGSFTTLKSAAEHKIELLLKGFEGSFVTAYQNGERISLKDAGAAAVSKENLNIESKENVVNSDLVKFTVQLASFSGRVPASVLSDLMSIGNVRPIRGTNGTTSYVYGSFETIREAQNEIIRFKGLGFDEATVMGEFNGKIISAEEAEKLKE